MILGKALIRTRFGSNVIAIADDGLLSVQVVIPDLYSDSIYITTLTLMPREEDVDVDGDDELEEYIKELLPDILDLCIDKVYRARYYYEFDLVDKVDPSDEILPGEYYIAVEKELFDGYVLLSIVGVCDDGASFLDESTITTVYRNLSEHSYDENYLPILEEDQASVTKFTIFRC